MALPFLTLKSTPLLLLIILGQLHGHHAICPDHVITTDGWFPDVWGAVPANYNCILEYEIPAGYIVRFTLIPTAPYEDVKNVTFVVDAQHKTKLFSKFNPFSYIFSTAETAALHIHTGNQSVNLWIKYNFIDIRNYTRKLVNAGTAQKLNFPTGSYLTFMAMDPRENGKLRVSSGSLSPETNPTQDFYVFDGESLDSPCLGTLADMENKKIDSGNLEDDLDNNATYLSLVHFVEKLKLDGVYAIANTEKSLESFNNYSLLVSAKGTLQHRSISFSNATAVTVILHGGNVNYLDELNFISGNGTVEVFPMAPFHQNSDDLERRERWQRPLLIYDSSTYNKTQMRSQQIPTSLFTIVVKKAKVSFNINNKNGEWKWVEQRAGKQFIIFSPSLWNSTATSEFHHKFYTYTWATRLEAKDVGWNVTVISMNITQTEQFFGTVIGAPHEQPTKATVKCRDELSTCSEGFEGPLVSSGEGRELTVNFTGKDWPSFAVIQVDTFEVEDRSWFLKMFIYTIRFHWLL